MGLRIDDLFWMDDWAFLSLDFFHPIKSKFFAFVGEAGVMLIKLCSEDYDAVQQKIYQVLGCKQHRPDFYVLSMKVSRWSS